MNARSPKWTVHELCSPSFSHAADRVEEVGERQRGAAVQKDVHLVDAVLRVDLPIESLERAQELAGAHLTGRDNPDRLECDLAPFVCGTESGCNEERAGDLRRGFSPCVRGLIVVSWFGVYSFLLPGRRSFRQV